MLMTMKCVGLSRKLVGSPLPLLVGMACLRLRSRLSGRLEVSERAVEHIWREGRDRRGEDGGSVRRRK